MTELEITAENLQATQSAGQRLATHLSFPACVYLKGEMGAGKTTLCKAIINAFGYVGDVTSPTYNLIQEYPTKRGIVYHMDLYRVEDPSELECLALEDLWSPQSLFLIEWAERGGAYLQTANFEISLRKIFDKSQESRHIVLKKNN